MRNPKSDRSGCLRECRSMILSIDKTAMHREKWNGN
jgi:hypothetical protein